MEFRVFKREDAQFMQATANGDISLEAALRWVDMADELGRLTVVGNGPLYIEVACDHYFLPDGDMVEFNIIDRESVYGWLCIFEVSQKEHYALIDKLTIVGLRRELAGASSS